MSRFKGFMDEICGCGKDHSKDKKKEKIEENTFNNKEAKKIIDNAFKKMWDGFNDIDKILANYFKKTGQGGMYEALRKEMKLDKLKNALDDSDKGVPNSLS